MTLDNSEKAPTNKNIIASQEDMAVLSYLALKSLSNRYRRLNERKINQEIGKISMNLIDSEHTNVPKKNLLYRKKALERTLKTIDALKNTQDLEENFVKTGKTSIKKFGISTSDLIALGIHEDTLIAAKILSSDI